MFELKIESKFIVSSTSGYGATYGSNFGKSQSGYSKKKAQNPN